MAVDVIMPNLGVSMKEGRVLTWRFKEGDLIDQGDEVVEIETDKVNYQVEAPISGILAKIIAPTGSVAAVGRALAVMVEEGESPDVGERPEAPQTETAASSAPVAASPAEAPPEDQRVRITPIARKMAFDAGLDVSRIQGGGAYGRIMKADVEAALQAKPADAAPTGDRKIQLGSSMPMSRMREIISQRLTMSARDVPHVYFMSEADASEMVRFRKTFLTIVESRYGVKLSFTDIILQAVAKAIEAFPLFNATLDGNTIHVNESINIGMAVSLDEGLIVPFIRNTNEKTLGRIAIERREIIEKARGKRLTLDDLSGGTFTVSNLGQYDVDLFTSIINPPETGILSVAKIKDRPVVVDGELAVRPTVSLGLSADHRVVDGAMAAAFLEQIKRYVENPYLLMSV